MAEMRERLGRDGGIVGVDVGRTTRRQVHDGEQDQGDREQKRNDAESAAKQVGGAQRAPSRVGASGWRYQVAEATKSVMLVGLVT